MAAREWMPILFLLLKAPCFAQMVGFKFVVGFVGFLYKVLLLGWKTLKIRMI